MTLGRAEKRGLHHHTTDEGVWCRSWKKSVEKEGKRC